MTASHRLSTCLLAASAAALLLVACGRDNEDLPAPEGMTPQTRLDTAPALASGASDASVPSADSVFPAASSASAAAVTVIQPEDTLSAAEESASMPMAGQGDSHSSPKAGDKSASAP